MDKTIQQKIIDFLDPISEGLFVADVRIGLGYTSVRLDNGSLGLAWTGQAHSGSCTYEQEAGTLAGRPARKLLDMLARPDNPLSRTIGLATANALAAGMARPEAGSADVLELIDIQASDHVVMVGFFRPLVPRIHRTGCRLDILELKSETPDTMSPEEGRASLAACSVAIITGTSIITGTLDGLLSGLRDPRAVVILGPSTFMRPEVFSETPVTHLAGARVRDAAAVEKIVSEGGGTMILKHHMDFETICLKR
ncbi:MAG TPA: DUF364 domain-containing protein [Deltaproteobacteria bacterium]|jgi:hypothetical protein|nr:DUF364 domain-containing protein [Deltaproteobacteria bacterium]